MSETDANNYIIIEKRFRDLMNNDSAGDLYRELFQILALEFKTVLTHAQALVAKQKFHSGGILGE